MTVSEREVLSERVLSDFLTQLSALRTSLESDVPLARHRDEHIRMTSRVVECEKLERELSSLLKSA